MPRKNVDNGKAPAVPQEEYHDDDEVIEEVDGSESLGQASASEVSARLNRAESSRSGRRKRARERTLKANSDDVGINMNWARLRSVMPSWEKYDKSLWSAMLCCCICGFVVLSTEQTCSSTAVSSKFRPVTLPLDAPPYVLQAPHMLPYMRYRIADDSSSVSCDVCEKCYDEKQRNKRIRHIVQHDPEYSADLLTAKPCVLMKEMSLVNVDIRLRDMANGYSRGLIRPFMDAAFVGDAQSSTKNQADAFARILQSNLLTNPITQAFVSHAERADNDRDSIPILPYSSISDITGNVRDRNPNDENADVQRDDVYALVHPFSEIPEGQVFGSSQRNKLLLGRVLLRNSNIRHRQDVTISTAGNSDRLLLHFADGNRQLPTTLRAESALQPFLFPHGRGMFNGTQSYDEYAFMRTASSFSLFTMYVPYMILQYTLLRCCTVVSRVSETVLQQDIANYRRRNPDKSDLDCIANCIRYVVPASIEGSPKYHYNHLMDLRACVTVHGLPHLFVTLTEDSTTDTCWAAFGNLENVLETCNPRSKRNMAPAEAARTFHARFREFWHRYVIPEKNKTDNAIFGRVRHWVVRYEFQDRGSLHAHCMLWLHDDDIEDVCGQITAHVPGTYDPVKETIEPPKNPLGSRLYTLVVSKQLHTCKPRKCRNQFGGGHCNLGFPYCVSDSRSPVLEQETGRYKYFRPNHACRNVVPYMPELLLLWGSHVNCQRVTNTAWSYYLMKYCYKAEANGPISLLSEDVSLKDLGITAGADQVRIVAAMYLSQPVSAIECAVHLLKIPIIQKSSTLSVRSINTVLPEKRSRRIRGSGWFDSLTTHPVDKYVGRPEMLDDTTLYEYFRNYDLHEKRLGDDQDDRYCGEDDYGKHVYKRQLPIVCRFTRHNPCTETEGFFYNLLLKHVPFRSELDIQPDNNKTYLEFVNNWNGGQYDWQNLTMEEHALQYAEDQLYNNIETQKLLEACSTVGTEGLVDIMNECHATGDQIREAVRNQLQLDPNEPIGDVMFHDLPELSTEQQAVVDDIVNSDEDWHFLTGCPGTGKTHTMKHISREYTRRGKNVIVCASTGAAALRLSSIAITAHSLFAINPNLSYPVPLSPSHKRFQALLRADLIIIDEISMLNSLILSMIHSRIESIYRSSTVPGGSKRPKILLCGDLQQLPSVCKSHPCEESGICYRCHISKAPIWNRVVKHELTVVHRTSCSWFKSFLNIIRVRKPNSKDLKCLEKYFVSKQEAYGTLTEDETVLCSNLDSVHEINQRIMTCTFSDAETVKIKNHHNVPDHASTAAKDWAADVQDFGTVAIGARLVVTQNMSSQVVNGSTGVVIDFLYDKTNPAVVSGITLLIDDTYAIITIKRTKYSRFYDPKLRVRYYKAQFPLLLAYAMTIHRCQGATIRGRVLINITSTEHAVGLAYVAFSRVADPSQMRIIRTENFGPDIFRPVPIDIPES